MRPPKGAPNIVFILIDDAGYGQFGTFGGQVPTPALDRVAADGLRYTRFHTTALCSPTRAALLTGRNHHSTGNGVITEAATGYDGYTGIIGKNVGTIAEVLRQYGYATAWFGKNHNTPDWETSQVGPFDRWPSGLGFDYFYGFMGGDMDQWQPTLYENHQLVPRSTDPNYILTHGPRRPRDRAGCGGRARSPPTSRSSSTCRPARRTRRTTCSPEYIAKYKGQFDMGWDVYREQTFARQKKLGVVPANAKLTPRPDGAAGLGLAVGGSEAAVRAHDGGVRRLHRRRPTTRWAGCSTSCARCPTRTTPSSSTRWATTAPPPRAAWSAC